MLPSFAKHLVTVQRASTITERGAEVLDWDNLESSVEYPNCEVIPASTSSDRASARDNQRTVRYTAYLPPSADVKAGDKIVFKGVEYAIDGAPLAYDSPTGRLDHIVVNLVDWEG